MGIKVLLVQIRTTDQIIREEYESFLRYSQLNDNQIETINVFFQKLDVKLFEKYDAVFIGGASEANVLEPEVYTFMKDLILFIQECIKRKIPTFASCFGFQAAVLALGGEVLDDRKNFEMGTVLIQLVEEAKKDKIFSHITKPFYAVSVHQQKTLKLPEGVKLLAYTDECIHAFKVDKAPFWAFQFHPEVDKKTLIDRLRVYQDRYTEGDGHYQEVIDTARETPVSNKLVKVFIDRILS